jgi:hypothetical protein
MLLAILLAGGRVYSSQAVHVGLRPAVIADGAGAGLGLTVQVTVGALP